MCLTSRIIFLVYLTLLYTVNTHRVRRIVGGNPAESPEGDEPVIFVRFAGHTAKVTGARDFPHYVFKGLRYAHAPNGKNRFQRPRQFFLQGDVNATEFPPPCVQPVPGEDRIVGDEDCLFMNIFTPTLPTGTEGLPVVVWIHGGGFRYGSASQYGVRHLVGKRLVVVTIQYRLGSLGFLSSATKQLPGNAGIWDMALAVQFVRNYIGFFGGNPHKIVVMGHGTGASSALLMSLSNIAKGMTSGIVAMSGTAVSHGAIDDKPAHTAEEIAEQQGCPTVNVLTMVKCLQNTPASNIIKSDSELERNRLNSKGFVSGLGGVVGTAPAVEGMHDGRCLPPIIQQPPIDQMRYRKLPKIPLLTGVTKDETKRAIHSQYRNELISKIKTIPNFLNEVLVKNLQNFTILPKRENSTSALNNAFDVHEFGNYLKTESRDVHENLDKISEATGDALFNLPAFLTADLWSKSGAPTYLYRFEHSGGRARKAYSFLKGLPIIGNITTDVPNIAAHGDDLGYVFEARHINGTSFADPENLTEDDLKVREVFTQMIADFARQGKVQVDGQELPSFTSTANNFLQISATPKIGKNFKFYEMALWAGLTQRLQEPFRQIVPAIKSMPESVENAAKFDMITGGLGRSMKNIKWLNQNARMDNEGRNPFRFW